MENTFSSIPKSVLVLAGFIGGSLIISALIVSTTFYNIRALDNTLSVTGSAKVSVSADQAKWVAQFTRTVGTDGLKLGYQQIASDLVLVKKFYADNGISEKDLDISPVSMQQDYSLPQGAPKMYLLSQTITTTSSDVQKMSSLSKNTIGLINQGIIFQTQNIEYTYSKLADLRVSLLGQAIADAKARATQLAKAGGKTVGDLKAASSGVVQVLPKNSVDVSDYGSYDISGIEKDIMVTTKATFTLQ